MRHTLVIFGDGPFVAAAQRLRRQAEASGWWDDVQVFQEATLDASFKELHGAFMDRFRHVRGWGYWVWKPFLAEYALDRIADGDCLWYIDAGCELNTTPEARTTMACWKARLFEEGTLVLQQEWREADWTKTDAAAAVGVQAEDMATGQLLAGIWAVRKSARTQAVVRAWHAYACNPHLLTDEPGFLRNAPTFREHRHDASLWSLVWKRAGVQPLTDCTWAPPHLDWSVVLRDVPVWARRSRAA